MTDSRVDTLFDHSPWDSGGFPGGQTVKNLPAMQETGVLSLSPDNPLEKGVATRFSSLAWKIPWTKEPGGLQSKGSQLNK